MLQLLGLYKKTGKLVFLGLGNTGKTTLLQIPKDDTWTYPSAIAHFKTTNHCWPDVTTFDVGGHVQA